MSVNDTSIASQLRELGKNITGKDIPGSSISEVIGALSRETQGGFGGGLPFDMLITVNRDISNNFTVDKTFAEIENAVNEGKKIGVMLSIDGLFCKFISVLRTRYGYDFQYASVYPSENAIEIQAKKIRLFEDDEVEVTSVTKTIS